MHDVESIDDFLDPQPDKAQLDVIEGACHIDPSGNYCADVYNTGFNDTMEKIYQVMTMLYIFDN